MHISSTVDTFYEQIYFYLFVNQIRELNKEKCYVISLNTTSYLQSFLFVDIVELENTSQM